jgi:seryl-tRNA synthetase
MQAMASERTALQAENARLKRELEDMRKERDTLKAGSQGTSARVAAAQAAAQTAIARSARERQSTESELAQLKGRMQELIAKFRETVQTLKNVESEQMPVRESLALSEQTLKACVGRNNELYKLNDEVLTRFDNQSPLSCVVGAEPFTRIQRARLENLIDGYRARADDQKIEATNTQAQSR